ncbi:protein-lysine N-methyltransferase EEF2KMT-like isoform X2 [Acropora muricata]|uniref:protein-lysine N-methyltransferase EEF2KMT-like isoform X2 n=1 Tax=Acropora muricata TaxID=159855 RepID=UPI0034E37BB7
MADASKNLLEIQRQYLQMNQLKGFTWKGIEHSNLGLETQRKILNMTYLFTLKLGFAPSVSYQRLFLKQFFKLCDDKGYEICDELYEAYGTVLGKSEQWDDKCYKTYTLPCGGLITLEETQQYICNGTTGLSTWTAGKYLAEWALENSSIFQERNIIELGSGTGLTGLTVCATSSPCQYIMTDCHEKVLETLNHNLILNNYHGRKCLLSGENEMPGLMEQCTTVTQEGGSDKYSPVDGNNYRDHVNKKQTALHVMQEGGPCLNQTGYQSCSACRALATDDNCFNMTDSDRGTIAYYTRKPLVIFHHINEDCGLHSGKAQVSVCHLDWINNWKADHFSRLRLGIILAAGKHDINWCEVNKPKNGLFYCDHSCEIKIIRLYL